MQKTNVLKLVSMLLLTLLMTGSALAQEGVVSYERYDVTLTLQQNSGVSVEEIHAVSLASGVTEYTVAVPTDRLESLSNFQVFKTNLGSAQNTFVQADSGEDFTFSVTSSDGEQLITLHFPPNTAASTQIVVRYFVGGMVRFYDTGDILEWRPFGTETQALINSTTIAINLPEGLSSEQISLSSSGPATENFVASDTNRAIFRATNVAAGSELVIEMTLPHGFIQGQSPAWQVDADSLAFWTPVLQYSSLGVAVLLLLIGPFLLYGWWYLRLRVEPEGKKKKTPKYIKTPPSSLTPAMAGLLLDGKPQPHHIMAMLLDLAGRGAMHVYPAKPEDTFAVEAAESDDAEAAAAADDDTVEDEGPHFNLYGVNQDLASQPYETTLYTKIFGFQGGRKRKLSDVRKILFMAVPEIKNQLEAEIIKSGYLTGSTSTVHRQYIAFGGAAIIMSIILGLLFVALFSRFTLLVVCPFISLALLAGAFIALGFAAPKHTPSGAAEVIQWSAFKRFLKDVDASTVKQARVRFPQLLPYAITFKLDKQFVEKFAEANAAVPHWWGIPPEKGPDTGHENAHSWVSATDMSKPKKEKSQPEKKRTKSVIRRLGQSNKDQGELLKDVLPEFETFLQTGRDVFAKAPSLDEDELDTEGLPPV